MNLKKQAVWLAGCLCTISVAVMAGSLADLEQSAPTATAQAPKMTTGQSVPVTGSPDEAFCINLTGSYSGLTLQHFGNIRQEYVITQKGCESLTINGRSYYNGKWIVWPEHTYTNVMKTLDINGKFKIYRGAAFGLTAIITNDFQVIDEVLPSPEPIPLGGDNQYEIFSKDVAGKLIVEKGYVSTSSPKRSVFATFHQD